MKEFDSDSINRPLDGDDVIVVSAEDCANAYLEFSSEATLPSPVTRAQRREFDSEFLSEDDPEFLERVRANAIVEDDWGLTSESDAATTALVVTAASDRVSPARQSAIVPMRGTSGIFLAVATVAAFATGALGVRVVLGPPQAGTATRVTPQLPPAPPPPATILEREAGPAVSVPFESSGPDRQVGAGAPQHAASPLALSMAYGTVNSPRPVPAAAVTRVSPSSGENGRSPDSEPSPTPSVVSATLTTGAPPGDSAATVPGSAPLPAPLETSATPLRASSIVTPTPYVSAITARGGVDRVLARYQAAFSDLDVDAVHQIWPTADRKALIKAFEQLEEERLTFESCDVTMGGNTAAAVCSGTTRYVPRVGNKSVRVQRQQWHLSLRQAADVWVVDSVDIRPRR